MYSQGPSLGPCEYTVFYGSKLPCSLVPRIMFGMPQEPFKGENTWTLGALHVFSPLNASWGIPNILRLRGTYEHGSLDPQ